jgi:hypothetical protein
LQHYNKDSRDGSLVDQHGSSPEEDRRRHCEEYDDGDLEGPVPYDQHEEVGHHEPNGDPDDEFDGTPVPLAESYAEADNSGYGGEEGLLVPDEHLSHEVGQARGHSRLQDRPHAGPETIVPRRETVTDPGKQTSFPHAARMNPVNYTPSQGYSTRSQIVRQCIQGRIFQPYNHGGSQTRRFVWALFV